MPARYPMTDVTVVWLMVVAAALVVEAGWTFYGPYYNEFRGYQNDGPYNYETGTVGSGDVLLTNCTYDQIGKNFNYMWIIPNWTSPTEALITHIKVTNLKTKDLASIHARGGGLNTASVTFDIYTKYARGATFQFTLYGHNPGTASNSNIRPDNVCDSAGSG